MKTDRRKLLTWGAGGALLLGPDRQASGQPATAPPGVRVAGAPNSAPNDQVQPGAPMKHPLVDNVVMLAELTVKPEMLEEFLSYTVSNLQLSRSARGNLAFDILIDEARPGTVLFYEVWESPVAQQAYMAWRTKAGDLAKLLSFLATAPRFTRLRSIAA